MWNQESIYMHYSLVGYMNVAAQIRMAFILLKISPHTWKIIRRADILILC